MLRFGKWEGEQIVTDRYTRVKQGLGKSKQNRAREEDKILRDRREV
jgi:hypothetical protein